MIDEFYQYIFTEYGNPKLSIPFQEKEFLTIPGKLPIHLIALYKEYGRFITRHGRIQTCHPLDLQPILSYIFSSDADFHEKCHAFVYSAFGIIYFFHETCGCGYINLLSGQVFCAGCTSPFSEGANIDETAFLPYDLSDDSFDILDENGKKLLSRTIKKEGPLEIGECYGFVPALSLGGSRTLRNIKRLKAIEHFAIVTQSTTFKLVNVKDFGSTEIIRVFV